MLNYIKADLYRLTKKKSLYIMMVLFTLGYSLIAFNLKSKGMYFLEFNGLMTAMSPLLIGIFVFTAIYTDDLKSHAVQSAIGFGIKRTTIIITKLIEAAILLLLFYLYALIHLFIINSVFSMNLDTNSFKLISYSAISFYLQTLVYFSLSGVLIFSLQKATFATVIYVLFGANVINQLITSVLSLTIVRSTVGNLIPFLIENVITKFNASLLSGSGFLTPGLIIIAYIIVSTSISSFLFNKVELDF